MDESKTIILEIELDTTGMIDAAADVKRQIADLKKNQKELDVSTEAGRIQFEKNAASIRELNTEYRTITKLIDNATTSRKAEAGSLEQMKAQLSIATKEYDLMSEAQRTNTDEGKALGANIKSLSDSLKKNESAIGDNRRNVGNYEESLKGLKAELKAISNQLGGMDAGSEQYRKAALRAGELKDKIKEVNENVKSLSGGSSFEKLGNTFSLLKGDLTNLDFAGVSEKAKVLTTISKQMTFAEATGGIKSMISTLASLGKAILLNPLFLLAGVVAGIAFALYEFSKAAKSTEEENKALKTSIDSVNESIKNQNDLIDYSTKLQIINLKNLGATQEAIAIKQINSLKEKEKIAREAYIEAEEQNKAALKRYGEEDELTKASLSNSKKLYSDYQKAKQAVIIAGKEAESKIILEADAAEEKAHTDSIKKKEDADKKAAEKHKADLKISLDNESKDKTARIQLDILNDKELTEKWVADKARLLRDTADKQLAQEHVTNIQSMLIEKEYQLGVEKLYEDTAKAQEAITKANLDKRLQMIVDSSEKEQIEYSLEQLKKKQSLDDALSNQYISQETYIKELDNLNFETAQRQKEIEVQRLAAEIVEIKETNTQKLKLELELAQKKNEIVDARQKREIAGELKLAATDKALNQQRLQGANQFFGGLASLFEQGTDGYKAFATAQVIASTALGAMGAFSQASAAYPPPYGEIAGALAAGVVIAEGAVQVAKINDIEFYEGGYSTKGNPRSEANNLGERGYKYHKNEYIVPDKVLSTSLGSQLVGTLEQMRIGNPLSLGVSGFADGGFAARSLSENSLDNQSIVNGVTNAVKNLKIVVGVEDILAAQASKAKVVSRAVI